MKKMSIQKNNVFDEQEFKNPGNEYKGTPFWAWNYDLDKEDMLWQIKRFKEMGFGGFLMHSRAGLNTKYLGEKWFDCVKECVKKAKEENMYAHIYDEDRWPSGAAGGLVTKDPEYRLRFLKLTKEKLISVSLEESKKTGKPYLLACYDVEIENGFLKSCEKTDENQSAKNEKWYAYICTSDESTWYNGQTYVDVFNKKAIEKFIEITYEKYKNEIGTEFGKAVPSVFTDEPQIGTFKQPKKSDSDEESAYPWTYGFEKTYFEAYGEDITEKLPELRWDRDENTANRTRLRFLNHVSDRFCEAFGKTCSEWCKKNNIAYSGHLCEGPDLRSQTVMTGEAMRFYRYFDIVGMDILADRIEYVTAKQAKSVVNQLGKEKLISELYGVTGWDFDFRGHKFQGDWQTALGVNARSHHLAWASMKGEGKRDFPATISYHTPWYREYSYIEDHFSRLNYVLSKGKTCVNVGVIHPIESFWMQFGCEDKTGEYLKKAEEEFAQMTEKLLLNNIDFDFLSEALVSDFGFKAENKKLTIGEMSYNAVIVPNLKTMRKTTLNMLNEFLQKGGKIIFMGECPQFSEGNFTQEIKPLYEKALKANNMYTKLFELLENEREVKISDKNTNMQLNDFVYLKKDNESEKYLFAANAKKTDNPDIPRKKDVVMEIKGEFYPKKLNTLNGETEDIDFETKNGKTYVYNTFYEYDSLLLKLDCDNNNTKKAKSDSEKECEKIIDFKESVKYKRTEENVLLLDMAKYRFDTKEFLPIEEITKTDAKIRNKLGYRLLDGGNIQPWSYCDEGEDFAELIFEAESEIEAECSLAFEEALEIKLNGEIVNIEYDGYYVDKSVKKVRMPKLKKGINEIYVKVPVTRKISIENFYLLGDFDVSLKGTKKIIKEKTEKIAFGSITAQGMPFYGGNVEYILEFDADKYYKEAEIQISRYKGALLKASLDNEEEKYLVFSPYKVKFDGIKAGKHILKVTFFGNRFNTFGHLHNCNIKDKWYGPNVWYSKDEGYSYEYCLKETGILSSPKIKFYL